MLHINRSSLWRLDSPESAAASSPVVCLEKVRRDRELVEAIHRQVRQFPTWGYRRVWAWLRHREGLKVTRKKVQRVMQEHGWQVRESHPTPRPRITQSVSQTAAPNQRWAIDATSCWTAQGWVGILAVIDCCTRQIVGLHVSQRGRAQEAEAALEMGCLREFGLLYPKGEGRPVLRSDNGKIFTSKMFQGRCKQYGLSQEFITPYTPQQNGMIERFFRSLKEECIWLHHFQSVQEAKGAIEEWVEFYNTLRPHQALKYRSPDEHRAQVDLSAHVA